MPEPTERTDRVVFPTAPAHVERIDSAAAPANPIELLARWIDAVHAVGALEPMYVTLATASAAGAPSVRTVQLLEVEDDRLLFTTNRGSRKGVEIDATGRVAVAMYWRETAQSVNVTGRVEWADEAENDQRFAEDARPVQASRSVSFHGRPLEDEAAQLAAFRRLVDEGAPIPRPAYWSWFRVRPDAVTFWEGHADALNRRLHYRLDGGGWTHLAIEA